ncbi:MAG: thioesterase family protein [Elusimicrobia bacterium]|nr:thioesterase family protein [Elusimicrobiota bacterium]
MAGAEIDELGHASNQAFLAWMMEAAAAHSAVQGWPPQRYLSLGAAWVVRRHEIDYLRPALAGDDLLVRTWVCGARQVTSQRRYEIVRTGEAGALARGLTVWAWVDLKSGKPARMPPEVLGAFEVVPDQAV